MSDQEKLVQIYVDLPNHWAADRETYWASHKGENLYEIRNVPFIAYGLNFLDVVRTRPGAIGEDIQITGLDHPSGHQTLRVIFSAETDLSTRNRVLSELEGLGASAEPYNATAYSVDIPPQSDFDSVFDFFEGQEEKEVLSFEGNEQRAEGSFDDLPAQ